jgi:peptidoglycan/LPS O-acetylase OafA/YrhL
MAPSSSPELRFRLGCPLALVVTGMFVAALDALVYARTFSADDWLFFGGFTGAPFALLALARARDWLAWLLAVALMAGLWTYFFYADRGSTDFMWGFSMMFAPLVIAGLCLAIAGMRGRIPWALEKGDPAD